MDDIEVWVAEGAEDVRAGTLRPSFHGSRTLVSSSFEYDPDFLARGWELSPDLPLRSGRLYAADSHTLPGAMSDSAPDEWGQRIIRADHALRTRTDASLPLRLGEFDYLLGVSDHTRTGSLRFRRDGVWLSSEAGVANIHELPRIVQAARRYEANEASDDEIAYLGDVATSPGGARPKASVATSSGRLAIAKLPHSKDGDIDVERWEALALSVAEDAGLVTPEWFLEAPDSGRAVLVSYRFDRQASGSRRGYLSAHSALGLGPYSDGSRLTYEDFADTIAEFSRAPREDLAEMFGRIALSVLINNVDDHWRNHAFLHGSRGWRLAPLFDVNPSRSRGVLGSRPISSSDDPRDRHVRNLLGTARAYQLPEEKARAILRRVAGAVQGWRDHAVRLRVGPDQVEAFAPVFDNPQVQWCLGL